MTEETSDRLANLSADALEHLSEWLQATEAFVAEQAPLVAQEIIAWGLCRALLQIALGLLLIGLIVVSARIARRLCGNITGVGDRMAAKMGVTGVAVIFGLMVFASATMPGIYRLCYILTAPRLYILDQLQKLM